MSAAGKCEKLRGDGVNEAEVLLYDYDTGKANVKSAHMTCMNSQVLPILKKGGSLTIMGMASMLGSEASNKSLSEQRARQVLSFLKQTGGGELRAKLLKATPEGTGTSVAQKQLQPAGSDNERYRSVYIRVWTKSDPPPPPKKDDILPPPDEFLKNSNGTDIPLPTNSLLDKTGGVLDGISAATGVGESILAGLGVTGLAATLVTLFSAGTGIASTVLGLFDSWMHGMDPAKFNGQCQGFWDAMQDMANQYQDSSLDTTSLSSWPQLKKPSPHSGKDPAMFEAEAAWRQGQQDGCNQAYELIRGLEANPKEPAVPVGGKMEKVTGRVLLRMLWKAKGNRVDEFFKSQINERLKKTNREWPIRK